MNNAVNAIILTGGKNARMQGEDKAFLEIEGKPIIERLINKLRNLAGNIIVVTNSPEKYAHYPVTVVMDEKPGLGPLMGIYSGLKVSSARYNFVAACDMPFVNEALVSYMIDNRDNYDALVPKIDDELYPALAHKRFTLFSKGGVHPLCAMYSKNCISVIEEMLRQDRRDVRSIFPKLNVRFLERAELEKIDKKLLSLVNINTRVDFRKIVSMPDI